MKYLKSVFTKSSIITGTFFFINQSDMPVMRHFYHYKGTEWGEIFLNVGSVTVTGVENGIIVMSSNSNRDSFFHFAFMILEKT